MEAPLDFEASDSSCSPMCNHLRGCDEGGGPAAQDEHKYCLEFDKETDNKFRYRAIIGDTWFKLYIFKDAFAPGVVPAWVWVSVNPWDGRVLAGTRVSRCEVRALAMQYDIMTRTLRYRPLGERVDQLIGEPYVPMCILPSELPQIIEIRVQWEEQLEGQGQLRIPSNGMNCRTSRQL